MISMMVTSVVDMVDMAVATVVTGTISLTLACMDLRWATMACLLLVVQALMVLLTTRDLTMVLPRDTTLPDLMALTSTDPLLQEARDTCPEALDLTDTSTSTWHPLTWLPLLSLTPSARRSVLPTPFQWTTLNHPTILTYRV